jgi:O-antigen ligase
MWQVVLQAGFLLLCLRFLVAATSAVYPDVWPVLVLIIGGLGLSAWRPVAALFAFTVSVPLLNGLGYVGLAGCPSPLSLVFTAIFVGWILRQITSRFAGHRSQVTGQGQRAEGGATDSRSCRATEAKSRATDAQSYGAIEAGELGSNPIPKTQTLKLSLARLATDVLITAVLASLVMQIARHHDAAGFWKVCCSQPVFGYGDPLYFITAAFVWLQGLFFFRMLIGGAGEKCQVPSPFAEASADKSAKCQDRSAQKGGTAELRSDRATESQNYSTTGGAIAAWAKPVFAIYGVTLIGFLLIQSVFKIPETNPYGANEKLFSPLEDIHSFGSFAVVLLVFAVALWQWRTWIRAAFYGLWIAGLLALVILSWSRATWLAGVLVLLLVAWIRLPKRWTAMLVAMGAIAVVVLNANANRGSWQRNEYLMRLISLARVENLASKSPERINLYQKAVGMIQEHPLTGHGIGSFYLTSVRFARPGDPYADIPSFAHNFLLQMAAEMGIPSAALFAALIGYALHRGYRRWKTARLRSTSYDAAMSPTLVVTMALVAYLITQMTANALNIYISNQFFFWFLMAAVLSAVDCRKEAQESQILKVE